MPARPAKVAILPTPKHPWLATWCWLYLVAVVTYWLFLRVEGDRWWPATLLLFGPRWIPAIPMLVLLPWALGCCRRSLKVLAAVGFVLAVPIGGFCVPMRRVAASKQGLTVRILSCNTHYKNVMNMAALTKLIADEDPDIISLQEWDSGMRLDVFGAARPYAHQDGEFLIASRWPLRALGDEPWRKAPRGTRMFEIQSPAGAFHIGNVHLASPHEAFGKAMHRKPDWKKAIEWNRLHRLYGAEDIRRLGLESVVPILFAGDFNLPTDSAIYREQLGDFTDAYSNAGFGFGMTYHVTWTSVRIDHILGSPGWKCAECRVGPNLGSPHRPVIAEMRWDENKRP